jgi:hypothetical protein
VVPPPEIASPSEASNLEALSLTTLFDVLSLSFLHGHHTDGTNACASLGLEVYVASVCAHKMNCRDTFRLSFLSHIENRVFLHRFGGEILEGVRARNGSAISEDEDTNVDPKKVCSTPKMARYSEY